MTERVAADQMHRKNRYPAFELNDQLLQNLQLAPRLVVIGSFTQMREDRLEFKVGKEMLAGQVISGLFGTDAQPMQAGFDLQMDTDDGIEPFGKALVSRNEFL